MIIIGPLATTVPNICTVLEPEKILCYKKELKIVQFVIFVSLKPGMGLNQATLTVKGTLSREKYSIYLTRYNAQCT